MGLVNISCKIFVLVLLAVPACATGDSVKVKKPTVRYFVEPDFGYLPNHYLVPDTNLALFHYQNSGKLGFFQNLGNVLTASRPLIFKIDDRIGFSQGITAFDRYLTLPTQIKYFNTRRPYTKLNYIFGSKDEQAIDVIHSQNVSEQFNVGVNLKLVGAQGFYARQKTRMSSFSPRCSFQSRSNRYAVQSNLLYQRIEVEENGGLTDDAIDELDSTFVRDALEVHLSNAQNQLTRYLFYLKHHLNFGLVTTVTDTVDSSSVTTVQPTSRLSHGFQYSGNAFSFYSPSDTLTKNSTDSSYYASFFSS